MAQKYQLQIEGIDLLDWNIKKAQKKVVSLGLEKKIQFQVMDYTKLHFPANSFDGIYTMETLVHAFDYKKTLKEFYRVLKPGGRLILLEYSLARKNSSNASVAKIWDMINEESGMHALPYFIHGTFPKILQNSGFQKISVEDITQYTIPMWKKFYRAAFLPYQIMKIFQLQRKFINATCSVEGYKTVTKTDYWKYNIIVAKKPK